jgi:hypothetical protein
MNIGEGGKGRRLSPGRTGEVLAGAGNDAGS